MRSTCISNIIFFKHKYILMPTISKSDVVVSATANLAQVPQKKIATNIGDNDIE